MQIRPLASFGTNQPTLLNSEGDDIVFHTVTFPLASDGSHDQVGQRLSHRRAAEGGSDRRAAEGWLASNQEAA
jgi:hypothetical protein